MIITINGDKIDYTLEDETTAGDIIAGLGSWLEESGLLIAGASLDDEAVPLAGGDWTDRKVGNITAISVEAVSRREARIRQLETARDFFVLMKGAADTGDNGSMEELSEGFPDLMRILPHLLGEAAGTSIIKTLEDSFISAGFPLNSETVQNTALIADEAVRMATVLEARRRETESPDQEAASAAKALAHMSEDLDDVAVYLQTGKDRQAMETIIILTELLQALMRALSWSEVPEARALVEDMTGILAELEDALKVTDTVLIGDLLEYEIKPRLQELPTRLDGAGEAAS